MQDTKHDESEKQLNINEVIDNKISSHLEDMTKKETETNQIGKLDKKLVETINSALTHDDQDNEQVEKIEEDQEIKENDYLIPVKRRPVKRKNTKPTSAIGNINQLIKTNEKEEEIENIEEVTLETFPKTEEKKEIEQIPIENEKDLKELESKVEKQNKKQNGIIEEQLVFEQTMNTVSSEIVEEETIKTDLLEPVQQLSELNGYQSEPIDFTNESESEKSDNNQIKGETSIKQLDKDSSTNIREQMYDLLPHSNSESDDYVDYLQGKNNKYEKLWKEEISTKAEDQVKAFYSENEKEETKTLTEINEDMEMSTLEAMEILTTTIQKGEEVEEKKKKIEETNKEEIIEEIVYKHKHEELPKFESVLDEVNKIKTKEELMEETKSYQKAHELLQKNEIEKQPETVKVISEEEEEEIKKAMVKEIVKIRAYDIIMNIVKGTKNEKDVMWKYIETEDTIFPADSDNILSILNYLSDDEGSVERFNKRFGEKK